jgi:hypothetical protein
MDRLGSKPKKIEVEREKGGEEEVQECIAKGYSPSSSRYLLYVHF